MTDPIILDIRHARFLIANRGWHPRDCLGGVSLRTALMRATWHDGAPAIDPPASVCDLISRATGEPQTGRMGVWELAPERTGGEVLALLDACAEDEP